MTRCCGGGAIITINHVNRKGTCNAIIFYKNNDTVRDTDAEAFHQTLKLTNLGLRKILQI